MSAYYGNALYDHTVRQTLETKIEAGVLSVRFDGGYWIVLAHSATHVVKVEDRGGDPRAGTISYRNNWGLTVVENFILRGPKRLG